MWNRSEGYCVEEAQKVADDVSMVWAEKMVLNDVADHWSPYWEMNYEYNYDNLFILKDDGKCMPVVKIWEPSSVH